MNKINYLRLHVRFFCLFIYLTAVLPFAMAQRKAKADLTGGWTPLFDGKTLNGWKQTGGEAKYYVEDGAIVGVTTETKINTFLITEATYSDFIFECEVNVEYAMNSGVQFRSLSKADYQNGRVHGYQLDIDATARNFTGGIYDESRRGWLTTPELVPTAHATAFRFDQPWNHLRIEAIGPVIRTFVNGIETGHLIDAETPSGFFGLQVHSIYGDMRVGQKVKWRNIRIQTGAAMKPTPLGNVRVVNTIPNDLSPTEQAQGYRLLWDGKTTQGWRGAYKDKFPEKGWEIANGELRVQKSDGAESAYGGDILTTEQFGAFELLFDFKLTPGANSGVKYFVKEWLQYTHEYQPGQSMTVPPTAVRTGSAIGLEYQILDDKLHPDAKMGAGGNRTLASLYDLMPADKTGYHGRAVKPIGEWNQGRIVVEPNNKVTYFLNGFKMLEYERLSPLFNALVERSKYATWGKDFGAAAKGPILLQDHGDAVSFRSLKIRSLEKK